MLELLPLSIGIGLSVGLIFTEIIGLATGGLIVPGYIALFMHKPIDIAVTIGLGYLTFLIVRAISTFLIVYGRRRTALMILFGYLFGMIVSDWTNITSVEYEVIGYIIPGLIALWMDRQGVLQTLASLAIVSTVVRLILIILLGNEVAA